GLQLFDRTEDRRHRVVDPHVDATPAPFDLARRMFDLGGIGHIGPHDEWFGTEALHFLLHALKTALAAGEQRDAGTPRRECVRRCSTNAPRGAGNDHYWTDAVTLVHARLTPFPQCENVWLSEGFPP